MLLRHAVPVSSRYVCNRYRRPASTLFPRPIIDILSAKLSILDTRYYVSYLSIIANSLLFIMFRTRTTPKPTIGRGRGPTITCTPLPPAQSTNIADTACYSCSGEPLDTPYHEHGGDASCRRAVTVRQTDSCEATEHGGDASCLSVRQTDDPDDPYAKAKRLAPYGTFWADYTQKNCQARPGDRLRETLRRHLRA